MNRPVPQLLAFVTFAAATSAAAQAKPSYTPADIPHVIHYGLHWKLDDWEFDKHNYFDFDPFKCPPWPAWQGYERARAVSDTRQCRM